MTAKVEGGGVSIMIIFLVTLSLNNFSMIFLSKCPSLHLLMDFCLTYSGQLQ